MSDAPSTRAALSTQALARTIDGIEFDPSQPKWSIPTAVQGSVSFNFTELPGVSEGLRHNIKEAFVALLSSNSPERIGCLLVRLRAFLKFLVIASPTRKIIELTDIDIKNYGASLSDHQQFHLRSLRSILIEWAKTGVGGLSHELLLLLPQLETKNHKIGVAVLTKDPESGPLNDIEYESMLSAIRQAFSSGRMSVSDYALLVLAISLGCRPTQLAMMKVEDLQIGRRRDKSKVYILQVTRLKQGKNIRPRTIFRSREIAPAVGALLEQQIAIVAKWAKRNGLDPRKAPLFPSTTKAIQRRGLPRLGLDGHHDGGAITSKITKLLGDLKVPSIRTQKQMRLFQTRIRRTFGSRAAAEGLSPPIIADLMDHSYVNSSLVYIEASPKIIERIDKALAFEIAPLAQAFVGTLQPHPSIGSDRRGRVIHIETATHLQEAGACGKFDFCGLAKPLACYTCPLFRPWLDTIHEFLLDQLLAERERLQTLSDPRIAAVNDRTIFAVTEVVRLCRLALRSENAP